MKNNNKKDSITFSVDVRQPGNVTGVPNPSLGLVTVQMRTAALVRGLALILEHHSCRPVVRTPFLEQITGYLNTSFDEKVWLKRSKYLLTYPLSKYLRCEQPPGPDVLPVFSGAPKRWMKNRLVAFNNKNTHLWFSWFQGKRCSLPASDDFVRETYDEHLRSLSKEDPGDEYAISAIFSDPTFEHVLKGIRSEVRKDFEKNLFSSHKIVNLPASKSACFEKTRSEKGQQGELLERCGLYKKVERPKGMREPPGSICMHITDPIARNDWQRDMSRYIKSDDYWNCLNHTTDLWSMVYIPKLYSKTTRFNVVGEIRAPIGYDQWESLGDLIDQKRYGGPLECTIQAVLEPFKVRVISKGEALPYYSCRSLQKSLWNAMNKVSCFRLTGRPFCPDDMLGLREKAKETDLWFSVDYSAATDGISWRYTSRILRYVLDGLPKGILERALSVLGPHKLYYPGESDGRGIPGPKELRGLQTNGQLMGSILSFPILCLANLGVYLCTTILNQQGWSHQERLDHVLVNGDDMLYAADKSLWARHVKIAKDVGLSMSVGKAYQHYSYANINSTSVHCSLKRRDSLPRQINYLNVGLFFGQHKVQGRSEIGAAAKEEKTSFCANVNTLLKGSLPGLEANLLKRYMSLNGKDMREESKCFLLKGNKVLVHYRNLFLPESIGGMGIEAPYGFKYFITGQERVLAKNLRDFSITALKTTQRPLPGYELKKFEPKATVPWYKSEPVQDTVQFVIKVASKLSRKLMHLPCIFYSTIASAMMF